MANHYGFYSCMLGPNKMRFSGKENVLGSPSLFRREREREGERAEERERKWNQKVFGSDI